MSNLELTAKEKELLSPEVISMHARLTERSKRDFRKHYDFIQSKFLYKYVLTEAEKKAFHKGMYTMIQKFRYQDLNDKGTLVEEGPYHIDGLRVFSRSKRENRINEEVFEEDNTWKYNANAIIFIVGKNEVDKARELLRKAIEQFTYFENPNISVYKNLNKRGQGQINFDPHGNRSALLNDFGAAAGAGLSYTHNVTVFGKDPEGVKDYNQIAITHGGHALVGIRKWGHHLTKPDELAQHPEGADAIAHKVSNFREKNGYYNETQMITIWTQACETYNNAAGLIKGEHEINEAAKELWDDYLRDIARGVEKELKKSRNIEFTQGGSNFDVMNQLFYSPGVIGGARQDQAGVGYWLQLGLAVEDVFVSIGGSKANLSVPRRKNEFYEKRFEIYSDYALRFYK